jgi:hypothetical protein
MAAPQEGLSSVSKLIDLRIIIINVLSITNFMYLQGTYCMSGNSKIINSEYGAFCSQLSIS